MSSKDQAKDAIVEERLVEEKKEKKDLDYVYENYVGVLGFWQVMIVVLSCLSTPSTTMFPLFVNSQPKTRCNMGEELESHFKSMNYTFEEIRNLTGPSVNGCYKWNIKSISDYHSVSNLNSTTTCTDGYKYEDYDHLYPGSIVKEWNLVCDKLPLVPLGTNLYMLGTVLGLLVSGTVGDKFGRKRTAIFMGILELVSGFIIAFSPNYVVFVIFRSIVAGSSIGRMMVLLVISVETTNSKYRSVIASTWSVLQFFLSRSLLSLEAYLIPNWRILTAVHNIPCFIVLLFIPLIPESPRWLLSRHRVEDVIKIIKKGKRFNTIFGSPKEPITEEALKEVVYQYYSDQFPKTDKIADNSSKSIKETMQNMMNGFLILFKTKRLSIISIVSTLVYANETFVYYGIMFSARQLKQLIYLTCFFNALMCLPATFIVAIVYRIVASRKRPLVFNYIIAFIMICIGTTYTMVYQPSNDIVLNTCLNVSLIFLQSSLNMLYIYISELYPSEIRSRGSCYSSGFGRIGGSFCAFLNETNSTLRGLPFVVYGVILLIQLMLLLILPDTDGENLQDTV